MTETTEIKSELSAFVKGMLGKGFRQPKAQYWIKADEDDTIYVTWASVDDRKNYGISTAEFFRGASFPEAMEKAKAWLTLQPTIEQRQFREFAEILAKAVEVGKQNGIDAVLVNPLEQAMKKLSKNALMFQPEAA